MPDLRADVATLLPEIEAQSRLDGYLFDLLALARRLDYAGARIVAEG